MDRHPEGRGGVRQADPPASAFHQPQLILVPPLPVGEGGASISLYRPWLAELMRCCRVLGRAGGRAKALSASIFREKICHKEFVAPPQPEWLISVESKPRHPKVYCSVRCLRIKSFRGPRWNCSSRQRIMGTQGAVSHRRATLSKNVAEPLANTTTFAGKLARCSKWFTSDQDSINLGLLN